MAILLLLLPSLISLILCFSLFYFISHHFYSQFYLRKLALPPGNLGLPFIGETLQMIADSENPNKFIDTRVKRYGKIFTTHILGETTVFTTDAEVNRFILMNEGKLFESSYTESVSTLLGKHSLVMLKGDVHKKMYALTMSYTNSSSIRDNLLADIDWFIRFEMGAWTDRILLLKEAKKITFELTVKQLMSIEPGEGTENLRRNFHLLMDGFFNLPLPLFFTTYGKAIRARSEIVEAMKLKVRERRKDCEGGVAYDKEEEKMRKKDMLGILLEEECKFSDEEIVDFLLALIVGGYENTSTIMTLAVKFLTETPLALAQLMEEHKHIRANKQQVSSPLDWSDYKSMHFTQCVINETLRVANIAGGVFRKSTTDVSIKGYTIPKGCKILTCFRPVHLHEDHFKDAASFNPWRWKEHSDKGTTSAMMFTPFGGGPRLCPGYEVARVEISLFLHYFITSFSWVAEEDKLIFFPTLRTFKHYPINLHRRDELHN